MENLPFAKIANVIRLSEDLMEDSTLLLPVETLKLDVFIYIRE